MKLTALFVFAFTSLAACTKQDRRPVAVDPRNTDGPTNCAADQFKANEKCYAKAQEACDSLACAEGCDIGRSRVSKWITCSSNRTSSSMLVRCGGIANWQCPESTVCADDPAPGRCKHSKGLDCAGICVSKAGPLALCEGFAGWSCPENTVCSDDPRPGACSRTKDDDCTGVCLP